MPILNSWMSSNDQCLTEFWKYTELMYIYFTAQELSCVWRYIPHISKSYMYKSHTSHIYLCICMFNKYKCCIMYMNKAWPPFGISILYKKACTVEINIMQCTQPSNPSIFCVSNNTKVMQCLWFALVPTNLASCVFISSTKNRSWIICSIHIYSSFPTTGGQQLLHLSSSSMPSP